MKGNRQKPEAKTTIDPVTGKNVRQVTSHPSIHHHPFFFVPAYDRGERRLMFVSYRTGTPQIFFEDRAQRRTGAGDGPARSRRLVDHPSCDGRYVYFTAGTGLARQTSTDFTEDQLADFGAVEMREKGMVGAAMGTTALSRDGRWWASAGQGRAGDALRADRHGDRRQQCILERDTIGHPQFCPDDDDLILYAGPLTDRVWTVRRDGSEQPPAL